MGRCGCASARSRRAASPSPARAAPSKTACSASSTRKRPAADRGDLARAVWSAHLPRTERELAARGLAYFTYHAEPGRPRDGRLPPTGIGELVAQGWVRAEPIVYEDFLPRSAAGIFRSNLSGEGSRNHEREGVAYDAAWLSGAIGREVLDRS